MAAKKKKGAPVLQVTEPTKDVLAYFCYVTFFPSSSRAISS